MARFTRDERVLLGAKGRFAARGDAGAGSTGVALGEVWTVLLGRDVGASFEVWLATGLLEMGDCACRRCGERFCRRAMKQLELPRWGGKRPGAGRKRLGEKRVSHHRRPAVNADWPVHVTVRMRDRALNMRTGQVFKVLKKAFNAARSRFGMRLCQFSVMGNHVHMLVEADEAKALSRGMQGLGVRMARALNNALGTKGTVYGDHYHAHILKTPSEVARALNYVLTNAAKHGFYHGAAPDPFSSASAAVAVSCVALPVSWLLLGGHKRGRPRRQFAAGRY